MERAKSYVYFSDGFLVVLFLSCVYSNLEFHLMLYFDLDRLAIRSWKICSIFKFKLSVAWQLLFPLIFCLLRSICLPS